jgi:hypothetical protein
MHTIISNRETGKITLIASSLRHADLQKLLNSDLAPIIVSSEVFFLSIVKLAMYE